MADPAQIPESELFQKRDLGAVIYLSCYIQLMHRALGVEELNDEYIRMTVVQMVMPINYATEAAWRALMNDRKGSEEALANMKRSLELLYP
jgi:hypothetical protein